MLKIGHTSVEKNIHGYYVTMQTRKTIRSEECKCDFGEAIAAMSAILWGIIGIYSLYKEPPPSVIIKFFKASSDGVELIPYLLVFCTSVLMGGLLQFVAYKLGSDKLRMVLSFLMTLFWVSIIGTGYVVGVTPYAWFMAIVCGVWANMVVFFRLHKKGVIHARLTN